MKSYFLCLRKKDSDTLKEENIIFSAAAPFGLEKENCLYFSSAREFFMSLSKLTEEEALVIMAIDNDFFVNVKRMVCSVLSVKCTECEAIAELCKEDIENRDVHILMPEDCAVFPSHDGAFSGFAFKADKLNILFLPLDSERTERCAAAAFKKYIPEIMHVKTDDSPAEVPDRQEIDPLTQSFSDLNSFLTVKKLKVSLSVSPTGAKICRKFPENEEITFFTSNIKRDGNSPKTYAALLAKEAAEKSPSHIGAVITHAFKIADENKNQLFIIAAVANSEYVKVKKIYAGENDTASSLTALAIQYVFGMIKRFVSSEEIAPKKSVSASPKKLITPENKKIWITAICLIAAIAVILTAFGIGKAVTQTNADLPSDNIENTENYDDFEDNRHGEVALIPDNPTDESTEEESSSEETEEATETQTEKATKPTEIQTTKAPETTAKETTTSKPVADGTFVFTVYGYGHGVGMSQYGANAYAKQGWSYDKILTHYYTGTKVVDDPNMPKTLKVKGKDVETSLAVAMAVQGEMGSSFHPEALKAQAVAAYTYAMRSGGTCDGMYTVSTPSQAVIDAVNAVKGKYVSYNGSYINAVFFAYSGGKTVSSSSVWGSTVNYPYLVPVDSSPDLKLSNCKSVVRISAADMKKRAYDSYGVNLTGDPSTWLTIKSHDNSTGVGVGYVSQISMGGKILSGNQFRTYVMDYDIRSHCFSVEFIPA